MNIICTIFGHNFSMTKKEIKDLLMDTFAKYVVALAWGKVNGRVSEDYVNQEIEEKLDSMNSAFKKLSKQKIKPACKRCSLPKPRDNAISRGV